MPGIAAAPFFWGSVAAGAGAVGAAALGSRSAGKSARVQADSANRAGEIEAAAARETLAFEKEREAQRRKEFQMVQDRNYGLYQEAQQRLAPYRQLGRGAVGQLMKPIPRPGQRTIGSLMGGQ